MSLAQKIESHQAGVAVIGLGYVGLPVAVEFAKAGFSVLGLDLSEQRVAELNGGFSSIPDVPSEDVSAVVAAAKFRATNDPTELSAADAIIICVPTPFARSKQPDLSHIEQAARDVRDNLRPGMLVILESTTYPGTTEELLKPTLEESGLSAGKDFHLAFSPERIDPGNKTYTFTNTPKVVGGTTPEATQLAALLYGQVVETVVPVSSPKVAEMAKLYENTFRHVNIALANEMAIICDDLGIDVWEVIGAASTKPFGFMAFYPGPGVGGHCIPIDPFYLAWRLKDMDRRARLIEMAGEINDYMPERVVNKICDALNEVGRCVRDARVLLLGVAYKKDSDDVRESPALKVFERLIKKGAIVSYFDPYVPEVRNGVGVFRSVELSDEMLRNVDCVVVLTNHTGLPYEKIARLAPVVVDTRNVVPISDNARVFRI